MATVIDCSLEASEFELFSCYYVHFRTNTLGDGIVTPYPSSDGLNSVTAVFPEGWLWPKKTDLPLNN